MANAEYYGPDGFGYGILQRKANNNGSGATHYVPRVMSFGHNYSGATQYATFDVGADFGMSVTGGALLMFFHGWQEDYAHGLIEYNNAGGGGGITNVRFRGIYGGVGLTTGTNGGSQITVTLTSTHTNGHGWRWHILGGY